MEPVTLVLTALAAGAGAGVLDSLKDDVREKAKAAYQKLRELVAKRVKDRPHAELALAEYGSAPEKWKGLLSAELTEAGAAGDGDLAAAARAFLELVDQAGTARGKYNVLIRDSSGVQVGDGNVQFNEFHGR